jgi:hypothetical protein
MAKLERELDFRRVAGIELGGQSLGLLVAAILAWFGTGVWAPVGGQIVWQMFVIYGVSLRRAESATGARLALGAGNAHVRHWNHGVAADLADTHPG